MYARDTNFMPSLEYYYGVQINTKISSSQQYPGRKLCATASWEDMPMLALLPTLSLVNIVPGGRVILWLKQVEYVGIYQP